VFTNGCFDIIHRGHTSLFEFCGNYSLRLPTIVAVNSDESIRELKGPSRPIMKQEDRVAVLSSIRWIDHVIIFDTKSVLPVLQKIRPKILVKGADYSTKPCAEKDRIVGQEFVESYGGKVITAPLVEGASTTSIVKRMSL
tara:strand:- start:29 stop:448 length:420 start_codon:yes stop_codon:yes gene_type:complete